MKRIQYACLEQTLHFILKEEGLSHSEAVRAVQDELKNYKDQLLHSRAKYQIVEETVQSDDSVMLKIKKQYNGHDVGDYMS